MSYINDFSRVDGLVLGPNTVRAWRAHIAALEATIERMKCCGNCGRHVRGLRSCIEGSDLWTEGDNRPCHFTPSRWAERSMP